MVLTIVGAGAMGGLIGAHLFWCDLAVWKRRTKAGATLGALVAETERARRAVPRAWAMLDLHATLEAGAPPRNRAHLDLLAG